jgi:hypothetical protein
MMAAFGRGIGVVASATEPPNTSVEKIENQNIEFTGGFGQVVDG